MHGTGTQADPFVPYIWDEVVEAVGTSAAYVSFPENGGEYDLNALYPTGVSTIRVRCTQINGNGWNLKNLYSQGNPFSIIGTHCTWIRLNIVDFLHEGSDFFKTNEEYYQDGKSTFNQCKFSGIMSSGRLFNRNSRHSDNVMRLETSSINVRADNDAVVFGGAMDSEYASSNYCNVVITGNSSNPFGENWMRNCLIQGSMSPSGNNGIKLTSGSTFNIITANLSEATSESLLSCPNGLTICNSDLLPAGTTIPAGMVGCTTEQLRNASYLASLGFPIGVE